MMLIPLRGILSSDREHAMQKLLFVVALIVGGLIAYVDAQPNWDDTGITAAAIFVSCAVLGACGPSRPWLWALAVGLWIPVRGGLILHNYGTLIALVVAFAGAYIGAACRRAISPAYHSAS
jgi:hypothetical protein